VIAVSRDLGKAPVHVAANLADPACWDTLEAAFRRKQPIHRRAGDIHPRCRGYRADRLCRETDPAVCRASVLLNTVAPLVLAGAFLCAVRNLRMPPSACAAVIRRCPANLSRTAAYGAAKAAVDQWVRTVGTSRPCAARSRFSRSPRGGWPPPCASSCALPAKASSPAAAGSSGCTKKAISRHERAAHGQNSKGSSIRSPARKSGSSAGSRRG
jgi:hypothetical protein